MTFRCGLYSLVLLISVVALAGCGGSGPGALPSQPTDSPTGAAPTLMAPTTAAPRPATSEPETAYPYPIASEAPPAAGGQPVDAALIALAKKDLAQQLSVAADQITVVSSTSTDWPDSSLGCPKPGLAYAQVITPGYRIVLEQAQKQYDYHTDLTDRLVLCTP